MTVENSGEQGVRKRTLDLAFSWKTQGRRGMTENENERFGEALMKNGITRCVNGLPEQSLCATASLREYLIVWLLAPVISER